MKLEYLIVGIAKGNQADLKEYYNQTKTMIYNVALAYTGDRFLARTAAIESYRRIIELAYKFDTDMSAEYWHMDIVRNLCVNGLCDGELAGKAAQKDRSNVSLLVSNALFNSLEDRGKIIAVMLTSNLSGREASDLLWYNPISLSGEYRRGIKQAAEGTGFEGKKFKEIEKAMLSDMEKGTPEYFDFINNKETENDFSEVSCENLAATEQLYAQPGESEDARKIRVKAEKAKKSRIKIIIWCIIAAIIVAAAAIGLSIYFSKQKQNKAEEQEQTYEIKEVQYNTSASMCVIGDKLYFENTKKDSSLWSISLTGGEAVKISDDKVKDLIAVGENLWYRNSNNGKLMIYNTADGTISEAGAKGSIPTVVGDAVVYSSKDGISAYNVNSGEISVIYDNPEGLLKEHIEADEDGVIYFSAGATEGIYRLTLDTNGEYYCDKAIEKNVYDFMLANGYIIFDTVGDGTGVLTAIKVGDSDTGYNMGNLNAVLLSAAFCQDNGYIYYYGGLDENNVENEKGIYRIKVSEIGTGTEIPELVVDLKDEKYDVSDIYVSGDNIFCYFSGGDKKNAHAELRMYNGDNQTKIFG